MYYFFSLFLFFIEWHRLDNPKQLVCFDAHKIQEKLGAVVQEEASHFCSAKED
jgi:hypothetical protein